MWNTNPSAELGGGLHNSVALSRPSATSARVASDSVRWFSIEGPEGLLAAVRSCLSIHLRAERRYARWLGRRDRA